MTDWAEFNREDQRLVVLRILLEAPGYKANDSVLQLTLERFGHTLSRAGTRGILHWLYDHGLIDVELVRGDQTFDTAGDDQKKASVWICRLLEPGSDVATGREVKKGVRRPSPR